ncbi:hypothetical protein [Achromobacter arsenitoxydans]|uniref:Tail fiber protein n=1 Tax=Achromobacter arsenitoxydans SY8 TaxID=477184 RepID=H0FAE2_9BURK|nr:hypothetical protein [Achromobacter arsenitoxydans]EHK64773.1 hypothetical protein KYC_18220 [Achromobacter arsenitoxydans SY8]
MAITSLPTPPSRSDPENFAERADAFMAALPRFADEANALQLDVTASAVAADNDATAAAQSAYAAGLSRAAAASSADAAASSQQGASQKAAESGGSAALARQWATKLGEPVDTGEFSAKHYAQLAAQGMGLPVFPLASIPSTNVGPIFVVTQGPMEWVAVRSRYEVSQPAHGQCRFVYVSPAECRLMPHNGNGLIIGGRQFRIPMAGVAFPSAAVTPSTFAYVYARDDGVGKVYLEASTTGHTTHSDGVEVMLGDATRTLIGMVYTTGASQFVFTPAELRVASWFNRKTTIGYEGPSDSQTASTNYVPLTAGVRALVWASVDVGLHLSGVVWPSPNPGGAAYLVIALNGVGIVGGYGYSLPANASYQTATAISGRHVPTADGMINIQPYGRVGSASIPVVFKQDLSVVCDI